MPTPSFYINPYRLKTSKLYAQIPANGAGDLTVTRATTATRTNNQGILEVVGNNVPRIDFTNPNAPGVLIEPAATNQIRNNTMVGAVVGTPGTLPINWGQTMPSGWGRQILGLGIENGINYIDVRFSGTPATSFGYFLFETTSGISVSVGQQYSVSCYFSRIGTFPQGVTRIGIEERNSSQVYLTEGATIITTSTTFERKVIQRTIANTNAAFGRPYIVFDNLNTGQSYDFTLRIGLPQMELGSVATSPIPTSGTIQTRNADVINLTGASALIGQTEGTIYAEVLITNLSGQDRIIINLSDNGSSSNRATLFITQTNRIRGNTVVAGSLVGFIEWATSISTGLYKIAYGYAQDNFVLYVNGSLIGSNNTGAVPVMNRIDLGNIASSSQFNNRVLSLALYTTRLSNDELQKLTTL